MRFSLSGFRQPFARSDKTCLQALSRRMLGERNGRLDQQGGVEKPRSADRKDLTADVQMTTDLMIVCAFLPRGRKASASSLKFQPLQKIWTAINLLDIS
jgi:hypothetical protein